MWRLLSVSKALVKKTQIRNRQVGLILRRHFDLDSGS